MSNKLTLILDEKSSDTYNPISQHTPLIDIKVDLKFVIYNYDELIQDFGIISDSIRKSNCLKVKYFWEDIPIIHYNNYIQKKNNVIIVNNIKPSYGTTNYMSNNIFKNYFSTEKTLNEAINHIDYFEIYIGNELEDMYKIKYNCQMEYKEIEVFVTEQYINKKYKDKNLKFQRLYGIYVNYSYNYINKEKYDMIDNKYGNRSDLDSKSSWGLWSDFNTINTIQKLEDNNIDLDIFIDDMSVFNPLNDRNIFRRLNPYIVFVDFYSGHNYHQRYLELYKLRRMIRGTTLEGCYLTSLVKTDNYIRSLDILKNKNRTTYDIDIKNKEELLNNFWEEMKCICNGNISSIYIYTIGKHAKKVFGNHPNVKGNIPLYTDRKTYMEDDEEPYEGDNYSSKCLEIIGEKLELF